MNLIDSARIPTANRKLPAGSRALLAALAAVVLATGCSTTGHGPRPTTKEAQKAITPAEALARLQEGNRRFVEGKPLHRDWAEQRAQTAAGQYPYAVVLSCIDSRASSEIVFDQGLGDIFNARIAGNVLNDDLLGSLEFACKAAGAKLILVVGHSECGAVKGACTGASLGHLDGLLDKIKPSVTAAREQLPGTAAADSRLVAKATELNVRHTAAAIREQSPVLRELIDSGQLVIAGAVHDLRTGAVEFLQN